MGGYISKPAPASHTPAPLPLDKTRKPNHDLEKSGARGEKTARRSKRDRQHATDLFASTAQNNADRPLRPDPKHVVPTPPVHIQGGFILRPPRLGPGIEVPAYKKGKAQDVKTIHQPKIDSLSNKAHQRAMNLFPPTAYNNRQLKFLGTHAGDTCAAVLGHDIVGCNLEVLDLRANHIGDAGAVALVKRLADTPLKILNMFSNRIGDAGAAAIGRALAGSSVEILDLRYNQIGNAGARALGDGLVGSNVKTVKLFGNEIEKDVLQEIILKNPDVDIQTL